MRLARVAVLAGLVGVVSTNAEAVPVLQLDMKGGTYDSRSQTVIAGGDQFTVYAMFQPKSDGSTSDINWFLNTTYYISVALTPSIGSNPANLGSFSFGEAGGTQTTVGVTGDMTYGTPPIEVFAAMQGSDAGDLGGHGVYPTYFREFAFKFQPTSTADAYDSAVRQGGPTPNPNGTAYYATFTGDKSLLQSGYDLHFDLYSTMIKTCGTAGNPDCRDIDIDLAATFTRDAETRESVPEPATGLAMLVGVGAAAIARRRRGECV
jgi:PEP-CTERM motif-containing protein